MHTYDWIKIISVEDERDEKYIGEIAQITFVDFDNGKRRLHVEIKNEPLWFYESECKKHNI